MVQLKKEKLRQSILDAAYDLFRRQGYTQTTLRQIAQKAGTSLANVYVYFNSKYEIIFTIYDPWMTAKINELESTASKIKDPHQRLRHIIFTLWRDIPAANHGFARNIMQALSTANDEKTYDPTMVRWIEDKVTKLICDSLPPHRRALAHNGALAHVMVMALDGFFINQRLNPKAACNKAVVDVMCSILLGSELDIGSSKRKSAKRNAESRPRPH
jgi:AcrR family transcriptional regulator